MKRNSWTRVLSVLLTIAMMATLLVVPAAAAQTTNSVDFADYSTAGSLSANLVCGTNNYFTVHYAATKTKIDASNTSFDGFKGTYRLNPGGKSTVSSAKTENCIEFTTTQADATVKVWCKGSSGRVLTLYGSNKSALTGQTFTTDATAQIATFTAGAAGAHYIGWNNTIYIFKIEVTEGTADPTYTITDGSTAADVALSFEVNGKAVTATEEGNTVTVTADVKDPTNKELDAITAADADGGSVTVTNTDGVYTFTMPAKAVTVTATVKENSKTAQDMMNEIEPAVKAALNGKNTVAQADVNTEAAAKTWVEGLIADALGAATAEVTISGFQAATAGDETNESGTNGSFGYSIALSVTKGSDTATATVASEANVTITATSKMFVRKDLTDMMGQARGEIKKYGVGEKVDVFAGKIIVPAATMKALTDALDAATALDNNKPNDGTDSTKWTAENSTAIKNARDTLKTAIDTFKTAVEGLTETGTKSGDEGYVLDPAALYTAAGGGTSSVSPWTWDATNKRYNSEANATAYAAGTKNYFTVAPTDSRLQEASAVFTDGFEGTHRLYANKGSVTFTVTANATANLKVWWVSNSKEMTLTGASAGTVSGPVKNVTKNMPAVTTWTSLTAGQYTLKDNGQYIFRVEVQEILPDKSEAPTLDLVTWSGVNSEGKVGDGQVAKDGKVTFTLASGAPEDASYRLYDAATEGNQLGSTGSNDAVKADADGKITFTLTAEQMTAMGTADATWYLSAREAGKPESTDRTEVTVKPYIPVTSIELTHFTVDSETPDISGKVNHVLYEKMNTNDPDVTGGPNTQNPDHPNAWQLKEIVKPENATDKRVIFSNARTQPEYVDVEADGTVKALKAGTGRIRVTSQGETGVFAAFDLTVKVRIGEISITKADGTAAPTSVKVGDALTLKAAVTTSPGGKNADGSNNNTYQAVTWSSSDSTVAEVADNGAVTLKKPGTATITATSAVDETVTQTVTLTVGQGSFTPTLTVGNPDGYTGGSKARIKLTGVPEGAGAVSFTVKKGTETVSTLAVTELTGDADGYNYQIAALPAGESTDVTYTVTVTVAANDNWEGATATVDIKVLAAGTKNINITSPGATGTASAVTGQSAGVALAVTAEVRVDGKKDEAATAALTYAWSKGGTAIDGATAATYTVPAADLTTAGTLTYTCTISHADAESKTVTFTVTVADPALESIDVTMTAAQGLTYTDGALAIKGPVNAVFDITTAPNGHKDTVVSNVSEADTAVVGAVVEGNKLTITPKKAGTATVTLRGTTATTVTKVISVTVTKADAPAALTASDYTVTQPSASNAKGTITITQTAPEGTEYVYRKGDTGEWTKFPADTKSIEVEPGTYKIRVYVPKPELQNTTDGVSVTITAYTAPATVDSVTVASSTGVYTVVEEGTLQLTAQVHMSNNTVSSTETVTWSTSDAETATVSNTGLVTGVKAGTVTITATSTSNTAKASSQTITVTEKGTTPPTPATKYGITVTTPVNGTVTTTPAAEAEADTEVAITATPANGYEVDAVKVTKADNSEVTVTDNKFTMPAEAVTVTVTFKAQSTTPSTPSTGSNNGPATVIVIKGNGAKTETVENADGSKTTTTVDKDGTKTIVTEMPDGAKTEIVSKADGEKTITVTDAKGEETVSVKVPAQIPAPENKFVDVPEEHWAEEAINTMAGLGLVKGVDDVNHVYDMNSNITRAALASVLYRFSNGKAGLKSDFSDILDGAWYTDGVAWAAKAGVVKGYEDGTFGPDNAISRQELAVMLYRYAKLIGMDTTVKAEITRFNDSESVASWAREAMTWCTEVGIIKGVGGNTLNPEGVASRAECAMMLSRFIDLV